MRIIPSKSASKSGLCKILKIARDINEFGFTDRSLVEDEDPIKEVEVPNSRNDVQRKSSGEQRH